MLRYIARYNIFEHRELSFFLATHKPSLKPNSHNQVFNKPPQSIHLHACEKETKKYKKD